MLLFGCNAELPDDFTSTMNAIANLQSDLKNNRNMEDIAEAYGAVAYTQSYGNSTFSLIRYDADPIGLGTLERTWTFLQVVNGDSIKVYTLYEKSAEYPLDMEITNSLNGNFIIEISGATNVSRSDSSFVDFWEYSEDGLRKVAEDEKTSILGDWAISYAQNANTGENYPLLYIYGTGIEYGGTLTFHEDNTFERHIGITGDEDATKGTYSVQGDMITLKYDNGSKNTAIYLPSSQEIEYHLEGLDQSPVYEYYMRVPIDLLS